MRGRVLKGSELDPQGIWCGSGGGEINAVDLLEELVEGCHTVKDEGNTFIPLCDGEDVLDCEGKL